MDNNNELKYQELYDGSTVKKITYSEPLDETQALFQDEKEPEVIEVKKVNLSIGSILGFAFVAFMMILVLFTYISYTETAAQVIGLREEVSELSEKNRKLSVSYEETFDINEIEVYAHTVLNMNTPAKNQENMISVNTSDYVSVYNAEDADSLSAKSFLTGFVSIFSDYFG